MRRSPSLSVLLASAAVLVVVGGVVGYLAASGTSSSSRQSAAPVATIVGTPSGPQPPGYGEWDLEIAYGSTPNQVRSQLGAPTSVVGSCWLYRGTVGRIRGRLSGLYIDAMKFCFGEGAGGGTGVDEILSHQITHTIVKRDPVTHRIVKVATYRASWGHPLTIARVPDWYVQQSS